VKTNVFAYKGFIGIESSPEAEGLMNDPTHPRELGFILDAAHVNFSPEAVEELKKVKKSGDDLGEIDIFEASEGRVIFGWLGGPLKAFKPELIEGSKSYDASLIKASEKPVAIPVEFKEFIDGYINDVEEEGKDPDSTAS
jgi:hypothetical protein